MDESKFIGYEYRTVSVQGTMAPVYADGYRSFGWEQEGGDSVDPFGTVSLRFKRDRKIRNKAELTRLQRQFDACCDEILNLERSKSTKAGIVALIVGIIGCAFMAGSVFAVTAALPLIVLCAVLAVPGFVCWILPYFLYQNIRAKTTAATSPLIEKKYDEIYDVCEKASRLFPKKENSL